MGVLEFFSKSTKKTFGKGGVHPSEFKELTSRLPIKNYLTPKKVQIHLQQHIGPPSTPVVKRNDIVKKGQIIAQSAGDGGVPVHSPIYGKVLNVGKANHPSMVEAQAIVIESLPSPSPKEDGSIETTEMDFSENPNWQGLDKQAMLEKIQQAGIVGLGGAAFPTHRKLKLPENAKVDTLVINGAECEPYLTSDHRMMLEMGESILYGTWLMAKIIGVKKALIGIEDNKVDAAEHLLKLVSQLKLNIQLNNMSLWPVDIEVHLTHTRYPQGSEKQLVQALTGRLIPTRKLPMDVGVVVQNVATAAAVYDAIRFGRPLLERVVTLTGKGIKLPQNFRIPLGTSLDEMVQVAGGLHENVVKVINGGPMMGRTIPTLEIPVIKGTNGFIFMTSEETYLGGFDPCIMCGECIDVCPLGLEPNRISILTEAGLPLQTAAYGTHECFECGSCSYVCPSKRPLVQFIQVSKTAYRKDQLLKEAAHGKP